MSKAAYGPGPVPDRWMHCPRIAVDLITKKFMAFKTPLSSRFDDQVPQANRFPPKMIFDSCKSKKIKLGLWVDLTNTTRFYDKEDVIAQGCNYTKLQCRGHGESPSMEQTKTFIKLIDNFVRKEPLKAIAVHCTHGFNRTGFLIVSYLVEIEDFHLDSALGSFAKVRPPGIYKQDYINELYNRYGNGDYILPAPERPCWEYENAAEEHVASTSNDDPRKRNLPKFMDDVPGVEYVTDESKVTELQKKVQKMCGWKRREFPGSQPVTLGMDNIKFLKEKPYMVSWKADGTRYLMLIDGEDKVFFFDRDNKVFKVRGLKFPCEDNLDKHLENTLLDGEMVIDKFQGKSIPRFLAYDIIMFSNENVGKMQFIPHRMHYLENQIIKPRIAAMEAGKINRADEPFSVRKKEFWDVDKAGNLLGEKFAAALSHEPDGLIFQPEKDPYVPGRCDYVLKWKPVELNSVDFKMKIHVKRGEGLVPKKEIGLFVGRPEVLFSSMKYRKEMKEFQNKIIECKFENKEWVFMRERTDKSFPNSYDTALSVCNGILNPVTKEYLLQYIRRRKDEEIAEPLPKKRKV